MVPWYLIPITAVVSAVLVIIYYNKYSALAEKAELYAAQQTSQVAKSIQNVANTLKTPGK